VLSDRFLPEVRLLPSSAPGLKPCLKETIAPTTQRLSERSERHGSTNGALSFSQTFLSETNEYNFLNGNYEQDLRAVSIIHSSGINVLFFMLES
jgi:hypothetical protein